MTEPPTLADALIREWSKPKFRRIDPTNWVAHTIASARKFVLDKDMSTYLADLGYSWIVGSTKNAARMFDMLNGYRMLSRAPHPCTFIEYDMQARARRAYDFWAKNGLKQAETQVPELMPGKSGWLILQHPQVETAFLSLACESHSLGPNGTDLVPKPVIDSVGEVWTCNDEPPPYPVINPKFPHYEMLDGVPTLGTVLTCVAHYDCPQLGLTPAPWLSSRDVRATFMEDPRLTKSIMEHAGSLRFLWSFLASLNDTPIGTRVVKPSKGHMVGRNYKRFSEHSVITLNIPHKMTSATLAKKVLRATRRRAHMVRGHWRKDWRYPAQALCEHSWEPIEGTHLMQCSRCQGRKMWITEHQAGDASLGFVLHDYVVKHEKDRPRQA